MPLWFVLLLSIGVDQELHEAGPCLTTRDLDAALLEAGEDPSQWQSFRINVHQQNDAVVIRIFGYGLDDPIAVKTLPYGGTCDDLAATIAVILAASKTELPGFASDLSLPAADTSPAKASPWQPEVVAVAKAVHAEPASPMPTSLHVAGGVTAAGETTSGTIGAMVSLRPSAGAPIELDFGLRYNALAEMPLGAGVASWDRWTAMAAVAGVLAAGPGQIRIFAGPQLSLLGLRGRGYAENRNTSSFDAGAGLGTQFVLGRGTFRPCLGLQANRWFRRQDLSLQGANDRESVPRWDFFASVGLFFSIQ